MQSKILQWNRRPVEVAGSGDDIHTIIRQAMLGVGSTVVECGNSVHAVVRQGGEVAVKSSSAHQHLMVHYKIRGPALRVGEKIDAFFGFCQGRGSCIHLPLEI